MERHDYFNIKNYLLILKYNNNSSILIQSSNLLLLAIVQTVADGRNLREQHIKK